MRGETTAVPAAPRAPSADELTAPGTAGRGTRIPHVEALDGLRGLAVAAVVLFHGGHLTGGYLGVDVFFVLSGFLITSLLLAEARTSGSIRLGGFWARRARRLLPALFGMLLGVAAFCVLFASSADLARIRADAIATAGYFANWRFVFATRDYFSVFQSPSPLEHTWSLAIEEQFYLVWPLVFAGLLLWKRMQITKAVLLTALVGAVVAVALTAALYRPEVSRVYYGTDTRASGILIGASLAALLALRGPVRSARGRRLLELGGLLGAVVLAALAITLAGTEWRLYHGGFLVTELATIAVIAAVVHPSPGALRGGLAWRPLCWLGLISYGVYLWHWPVDLVISGDRIGVTGWPLFALQVTVTLAIAVVSYFVLEMPIRRGLGTPTFWWVATPATVLVLVAAFGVLQPRIDAQAAVDRAVQQRVAHRNTLAGFRKAKAVVDQVYGPGPRRILAVGDSASFSLAAGAPQGPDAPFAVTTSTMFGCGLLGGVPVSTRPPTPPEQCARWPEQWRRAASVFHPAALVVLPGPWDLMDREFGGRAVPMYSSAYRERYEHELARARSIAVDADARLVLLSTTCFDTSKWPWGHEAMEGRRARWMNSVAAAFARRHAATVSYLDLYRHVCPKGATSARIDGQDVSSDGTHLTPAGAALVWQWLTPRLDEALAPGH